VEATKWKGKAQWSARNNQFLYGFHFILKTNIT